VKGRVGSEAEKAAVIEHLKRTRGVKKVVDQIEVGPPAHAAPAPATDGKDTERVPPPPAPGDPLGGEPPERSKEPDNRQLESKRPARGEAAVVRVVDGVAHLSGRVADVVAAMRQYCEAAARPDVRAIEDRLEFPVPDDRRANPLLGALPREDVERYLEAQLRRHLGDAIAVDEVRFNRDLLTIRGTVADRAARHRALAVVRSMAILRGIDVEPNFVSPPK
jgi:osmotically-inducible protein OsmY